MNNHEKFNKIITEMLCNQASTTAKDVFEELEAKRITDNVDYISIPMEDWNNTKDFFLQRVGIKQTESE